MFERPLPDLQLILIESDRRIRRSLAGIVEVDCAVRCIASVASFDEALRLVRDRAPHAPDVVLVHLDGDAQGDGLGTERLRELRQACPAALVVALSDEPAIRSKALAAGAGLALELSSIADEICQVLALMPGTTRQS